MAYNPDAKTEVSKGLPADLILDAIILAIQDGKVKDFVEELAKWTNPDENAIQMTLSTKYDNRDFIVKQILTYKNKMDISGNIIIVDGNPIITYTDNSNLGKYVKKYGALPRVEHKVKVMTNQEGFLRLKLE